MNGNKKVIPFGFFDSLSQHLDKTNYRYTTKKLTNVDKIIFSKKKEFSFLRRYHPKNIQKILNVGIGNGLELVVLSKIYKEKKIKIIGLDLSLVSLILAKKLIKKNDINLKKVELIRGDAAKLPFADQSMDIVVMDSLLHEVFSYSPKGLFNWRLAIKEAYRVLKKDGLLYVEDFSAPFQKGKVKICFKTKLARDFYVYFRKEFRAFNGWEKKQSKVLAVDRKIILQNLPYLRKGVMTINLRVDLALEILAHFKVFFNDFLSKKTFIGDQKWIEMNEKYYITIDGVKVIWGLEEYTECLLNTISNPDNLLLLKSDFVERLNFTDDIQTNFFANLEDGESFIPYSSKKMKLLFKRLV